jgi:hypothetical protein
MSACSADFAASMGAGLVMPVRSISSFRAVAESRSATATNFAAFAAICTWALVNASLALAASCSVSAVMKLDCTHASFGTL